MRITENIISYNYLENVNQAREKIVTLQAQLASGKRVTKPSDDPRAIDTIFRLRASIASGEQYLRNTEDGTTVADTTSSSLDAFSEVFLTLKETVTRATNASSVPSFPVYAEQVDQLLSEAMSIANTNFNGKYLFGGTQTLDAPYSLSADRQTVTKNPNRVDGIIAYPVSDVVSQQVNIPGEEAFQGTGLFDLLIQIRNTLQGGASPTQAQSDAVTSGLDQILRVASKAAAFVQSLDAISQNLGQQQLQLTDFLSTEQDTDLAESIMNLKQQETMLDAALNTGAQVIPKTLLDFLR